MKRVSKSIFLLGLISLVLSASVHSRDNNELQQNINLAIKKYTDNHVFSGSILVAQHGKIIFHKGVGFAKFYPDISDSALTPIANTKNTLFGIGSITKTITAVMIMQLVQDNRLALTDKISQYITELDKTIGNKITIHHLLSHRSGLPNYFEIPGWKNGQFDKSLSLEAFSKIIYQLPLKFEPGNDYEYSNSGYFLLGKIIEKVTNKSYLQVLNEKILLPAKMTQTGLRLKNSELKKLATSYQFSKNNGFEVAVINPELFRAAGDLYSTTEDLFRFEHALYGEILLNNESKKILFAKQRSYGWDRFSLSLANHKIDLFSYAGQLMGYNAMLTRIPEGKISIILAGNIGTSYYERMNITQEILSSLYGEQYSTEKLRASLRLHRALYEGNLSSVIDYVKRNRGLYLIDESGVKSLAQQVGWSGLEQHKLEILRLLE